MPVGGYDWESIFDAVHAWVVACLSLPETAVVWGDQHAPRPAQPGVTMLFTLADESGLSWLDTENNYLSFEDKTVTAVDAAANTLTIVGHGLETGDGPVRFASTGTLPGGLEAATDYWLVVVDADTLKVSATFLETGGGHVDNPVTTIDLTSTGSGVVTLEATDTTERVGEEIAYVARGQAKATLTLECHSTTGLATLAPTSLLNRIHLRRLLPTQQAILDDANIAVWDVGSARWIRGHEDAVLFEPRSVMQITLGIPGEESETGPDIEYVDVEQAP